MSRARSPVDRVVWSCAVGGIVALVAGCGVQRSPTDETTAPTSKPTPSTVPTSAFTPTSTAPASLSPSAPRPAAYPGCQTRGDPRAGVNTPIRLIVRKPCIRVRGIAGCIFVDRGDGDTHIALLLPPRSAAKYLTPGNRSWTCGSDQGSDTAARLVVEVIPQHCTVRRDNCADSGHFRSPKIPKSGQHVTVTGPWVLDTSTRHGRSHWSEIHPAWRITVDKDGPAGDPG